MSAPAIGLLALATDETFEPDMHRLLPFGTVSIYTARVAHGDDVSLDSLEAMRGPITVAAASLPKAAEFSVIAYGCTSATAVLGEAAVLQAVQSGHETAAVTSPLIALIAACRALGIRSPVIVSPYVRSVADVVQKGLTDAGLSVPAMACFNEPHEAQVARLPFDKIAEAAQELGSRNECDGVILSCTNLPTLPLIRPLEAALGKPVLSSNLATAWHIRKLAGLEAPDRPSALLL